MKNKLIFLIFLLFASSIVFAQSGKLDFTSKVPMDPNVIVGKLDNGLTYYIRKNALPKDRAEFYLVVNAGAINEDDDQDGLAHFCEHMAFNGTKHFAKKQILDYLQKIGMKFGPEINAFTSHDVTTYMLQNVPIDTKENMDTSLMVLFDWASCVAFENEEIDKERGVIHEEWRLGRNGMNRMRIKSDKILYKGSKYANRSVIGDVNIIDKAPYETIKRFYNDFYRPDLQAIIAVGDFDVKVIEEKIKTTFSKIPKKENPKKREIYPVADHKETLISIEKDKEAPYTFVEIYYKQAPAETKNLGYYRQQYVNSLYNKMMSARLDELTKDPNTPFSYAYTGYYGLTRTKDVYMNFAVVANNNASKAVKALLIENERLKKFGFTQGELDRAKLNLLREQESQLKEKNNEKNSTYVWRYYSNFLENEPTPGIEFDYDFVKQILPDITLKEINEFPNKWITESNRVIVVNGPDKEDVSIPTEKEITDIISSIKSEVIKPYDDKVSNKPLLSKIPPKSSIVKTVNNKELEFTEWTLKNGVRVAVKPTKFKEDEILFTGFSFGGTSLYPLADISSAEFASYVVGQSGLGDYTDTDLKKLLAGKIVEVWPIINTEYEGIEGSSSPQDIELALQMIYMYFTQPRADSTAFAAIIQQTKTFVENNKLNPEGVFQDSITVIMSQHNPFQRPMDIEILKEVDFNKIQKIYKERFADASDYVFTFVGNIDTNTFKPLVETYLGNLPSINRKETFKDQGIRPPTGIVEKTITREMLDPRAHVFISFTGEYDYNPQTKLLFDALRDILSVRYTETIREDESGSYGVSVRVNHMHYPANRYQVDISFNCSPLNAEKLAKIALEEIEKIRKNGPEEKYLANFKTNKMKELAEKMKENSYWKSSINSNYYNQLNNYTYTEYEKMLKALTINDLKEAANKYLKSDNYVKLTLLPAK